METKHTTLTAAAAWRTAIALTCADLRAKLLTAYDVMKCILAFAYLMTSIALTLSESETGITFNLIGVAMLVAAAIVLNKKSTKL